MFEFIWSHDSDEFNRLQTLYEIGICDGGDEQDELNGYVCMRWIEWICSKIGGWIFQQSNRTFEISKEVEMIIGFA